MPTFRLFRLRLEGKQGDAALAGRSATAHGHREEPSRDNLDEIEAMIRAGGTHLVGSDGNELPVPDAIQAVLLDSIAAMKCGDDVAVVPRQRELTTQEAADLLNVSRPFLVQLLESGALAFRKVGTHRRVALADVLAYRTARSEKRRRIFADMADEARSQGLIGN